jgi:hypothetical protein
LIPGSSAQSQDSDRERFYRKQDLYPKRIPLWVKVFFIYPGEEKPSEENKMNNVLKPPFSFPFLPSCRLPP